MKKNKQIAANRPPSDSGTINIERANAGYESWMRKCTVIIASDLRAKHEQMKENPFQFLRGTFFRNLLKLVPVFG